MELDPHVVCAVGSLNSNLMESEVIRRGQINFIPSQDNVNLKQLVSEIKSWFNNLLSKLVS